MKIFLITFVLTMFAIPSIAFADVSIDYKTKCAACHGAQAKLLPKTARLLKVDPKKLALTASTMSKEEMIAIIEKGRNKMPGFEKELTGKQITDIVDLLIALRNKKK
jgi:mono/diheme cytochrome c family protein